MLTSTLITLSLPAGTSPYLGEATDVSMEASTADWYCTNRPIIQNRIVLPAGFRRSDVSSAQFIFSIDSQRSWSNVRPHTVRIFLNGHEIGALENMIPHGLYTFPIDPAFLNESLLTPAVNQVMLVTTHLNGGHYVVASDMIIYICLTQYSEWVAATSQAEADAIVLGRSFLIPAPTLLHVDILAPADGEEIVEGTSVVVRARIVDDLDESPFYEVTAAADNGNGSLVLYDDGVHGDGSYRDGVYANSWTPVYPGQTLLTVRAGSCTLVGDATVTVTVQAFSYDLAVAHGVPLTDTEVLTDTVTPAASSIEFAPHEARIDWTHTLTAQHTSQQDLFDLVLPQMQPGEVRQVASGTVVSYTGPSGRGLLRLPPLYAVARHLVALSPPDQTANVGGRAIYRVDLYNPGQVETTLSVSLAGLPSDWVDLADSVRLAAGAQAALPLTISVPSDATLGVYPFSVIVQTEAGGQDQAGAILHVSDLMDLAVSPSLANVGSGETIAYNVAVTNLESVTRTYDLSVDGLAGNDLQLPGDVTVGPGGTAVVPLSVTAHADHGPHPFTGRASSRDPGVGRKAQAILNIVGQRGVSAGLSPSSTTGGPGATTLYLLTVTNTGSLSDTYGFSVALPSGWTSQLLLNGQDVGDLCLSPYLLGAASMSLFVTPASDAVAGDHAFQVLVQSQVNPGVSTLIEGHLVVSEYGVQVEVLPASKLMHPNDVGAWEVLITNTGLHADTYDLSASGILAIAGEFSPSPVSVAAGAQRNVALTANDLSFALPRTYPFEVRVQSSFDPRIQDFDRASVTFRGSHGVEVAWRPDEQVVTDTLRAVCMLVITNTGNVATSYAFAATASGLRSRLELGGLYLLPHMAAGLRVALDAGSPGTYQVEGRAVSQGSEVTATDTTTLTFALTNRPPSVDAGEDRTAAEGAPIAFSGAASDLDQDLLGLAWEFGDGVTTTLGLTPTHAYGDDGAYTVTLTVSDEQGAVVSDTLVVTVTNVAPTAVAGPNQVVVQGQWVSFSGVFTDPGGLDTHTFLWDFGDGMTSTVGLTPTHAFALDGVYTVTLTVTDDDGGIGIDSLEVTVEGIPDLHLTKTVTPSIVVSGDRLTYTLSYTNAGSVAAEDVILSDAMPPGLTPTGVVTWSLGTMLPHAGGMLVLTASVDVTDAAHALLTNTACISTSTAESNTANNCALAVNDLVQASDLELRKSAQPLDLVPGDRVTFTIAYTNRGQIVATDVMITDNVPAGVIDLSFESSPPITSTGGAPYTWEVGDLPPSAAGTIIVSGTIDPSTEESFVLENRATASTTAEDGDLDNNVSVAYCTVTAGPSLLYLPLIMRQ